MAAVYEIASELENLLECVDENGEFLPEVFEKIEQLMTEWKSRIESLAKAFVNRRASHAAISAEAKRLTEKAKRIEKNNESLESFILLCMRKSSMRKIEGEVLELSIRESESVEIVDAESIPEQFLVVKTESKPDKKAIKEYLKDNSDTPWARIQKNDNLSIK